MKRLIAVAALIAWVCVGDAVTDAQYAHTSWLRSWEVLGQDGYHWVKWLMRFYPLLAYLLWSQWPLWRVELDWEPGYAMRHIRFKGWQLHNLAKWLILSAWGWLVWWVAVRIGGAPWLP